MLSPSFGKDKVMSIKRQVSHLKSTKAAIKKTSSEETSTFQKSRMRQKVNGFEAEVKPENRFLQVQTHIPEGSIRDFDETESATNINETAEVENQLTTLREREEKTREQVTHAMRNIDERSSEIERILLEINNLQGQQNTRIIERLNKQRKQTEPTVAQLKRVKDCTKQDAATQTNFVSLEKIESYESGDHLYTCAEDMDSTSFKDETGSTSTQRLTAEMCITQTIIKNMKKALEKDSNLNRYHKDIECDINKLMRDIKPLQKILNIIKTTITRTELDSKEQMRHKTAVKNATETRRQGVEQNLQKLSKHKFTFKTVKIKRKMKATMRNLERMENEMARLRTENRSLGEHMIHLWQSLNQMSTEETERQQEGKTAKIVREQKQAEVEELNQLRERVEWQKLELDRSLHANKREIRELELLKAEFETKKKENELMFRKTRREKEECEMIWNEIQIEKAQLIRETKKKTKELKQRLEKNMRERDDLERLKKKLHQEKAEMNMEQITINNKSILIQEEKQNLQKQKVEYIQCNNSLADFTNMAQEIHKHLQIIVGKIESLENVKGNLKKLITETQALKIETSTLRDNINKVKSQMKLGFQEKNVEKGEVGEMVAVSDRVQKHKQELENTLASIKREKKEIEILKSELEIKRKEFPKMARRDLLKIINMRTEVQEERLALRRETQKRKRVLDERLERIRRERDELEILKKRQLKEKDESKKEMRVEKTSGKIISYIAKKDEVVDQTLKNEEPIINLKKGKEQIKLQKTVKNEKVKTFKGEVQKLRKMTKEMKKKMEKNKKHWKRAVMSVSEEKKRLEKEKEIWEEKYKELNVLQMEKEEEEFFDASSEGFDLEQKDSGDKKKGEKTSKSEIGEKLFEMKAGKMKDREEDKRYGDDGPEGKKRN